jgi:excisionase family DNA binding protein
MASNSILIHSISPEEFKQLIVQTIMEVLGKDMPFSEEPELLTSEQVQSILGVSKVTLYQWRKSGKIPYHRISRKVYYKKKELMEALIILPKGKGRRCI